MDETSNLYTGSKVVHESSLQNSVDPFHNTFWEQNIVWRSVKKHQPTFSFLLPCTGSLLTKYGQDRKPLAAVISQRFPCLSVEQR
jgi:hypothetical protein